MWRRWVRAGLVGVTVWSSCGFAHAQCTMDLDCKGDRICEDGACTAPPPPAAPIPALLPTPAAAAPTPVVPASAPQQASPALPPPPQLVRRSRAMMAGGIIMTVAGSFFLLGAVVAHSDERNCAQSSPTSDTVEYCNDDTAVSTYAFAITGVVLTAGGIPMFVYGAKQVPAAAGRTASLLPWATPNAAGLRFQLVL